MQSRINYLKLCSVIELFKFFTYFNKLFYEETIKIPYLFLNTLPKF